MKVRRVLLVARIVAAVVVLARLARVARRHPPLAPVAADAVLPTISVVVPARDEAMRLGPLLDLLHAAPCVDEVIVVDDQSSDATRAVAVAAGVRVVDGAAAPAGWAGKAWALQQGLHAATSEWIVTLDADTRPRPQLPASLVARAIADAAGFVTVAGRFECPTRATQWLHPAMLTTLVYRFAPPGCAVGVAADRQLANGQCMAFARRALLDGAGFTAVAHHAVEDVALARHLASAGWTVAMLDGTDLLTTRMFEDVRGAWRGWSRSLALPGVEPLRRQLLDVGVLLVAQVLPMPRLLARRGDIVDVLLMAARIGTLVGTRRAYQRHGVAYWMSPVADGAAWAAVVRGVVQPRQPWRGRTAPRVTRDRPRPSRTAAR